MSMLIHRCRDCTHPDFYHGDSPDCSYGACRCSGRDFDPEPEEIPTFNPWTLELRNRALDPGESLGQGIKQCDCARCCELLTGAAV